MAGTRTFTSVAELDLSSVDEGEPAEHREADASAPTCVAVAPANAPPAADPALEETIRSDASGGAGTSRPPEEPERYQLGTEHDRGGMGVVYRAYDRALERQVAIKQILPGRSRGRFRREARLTAGLQHPSIVPVYDIGMHPTGEPYYAMKFVDGDTLASRIRAASDFAERVALLPNVIAACEAVAYAHEQGVLHRDLKPSNILLGAHGETIVLDWGIAKKLPREGDDPRDPGEADTGPRCTPDPALTSAGSLMGTPGFMAPEQALGCAATETTDVYALGAILAQVITGQRLYPGQDTRGLLESLRSGVPARIECTEAPDELLAIARKATAWRSNQRYRSAEELAADLKAFQAGRLVRAAEYTFADHVKRFARRHRASLAVAGVAAVALLTVLVLGIQRVRAERNAAVTAGKALDDKNEALLYSNAANSVAVDPTATLAWLKHVRHSQRAVDLASAATASAISTFVGRPYENAVFRIRALPESTKLLLVFPGKISLLDREGLNSQTVGFSDAVPDLTVAADARRAYFVALNAGVGELSLDTGEATVAHEEFGAVQRLAVSPDGSMLAVASEDGALRLVTPSTGDVRVLAEHTSIASLAVDVQLGGVVACTSDGRLAAWPTDGRGGETACSPSHSVQVLSDGSWFWVDRLGVRMRRPDGRVSLRPLGELDAVALSEDGSVVATARDDGWIETWALPSWQRLSSYKLRRRPMALAVSPAGDAVAFGDAGGRVFYTATGSDMTMELRGHRSAVMSLEFADDASEVLSGDTSGEVRAWRVPPRPLASVSVSEKGVYDVSFHGEDMLLTAGRPSASLLRLEAPRAQPVRLRHESYVYRVGGAGTGVVYSAGWDGAIRFWRLDGTPAKTLGGIPGNVRDLGISPRGERVVAGGSGRRVLLWEMPDSAVPAAPQVLGWHEDVVMCTRFVGEDYLVTAGMEGSVRLWDLRSGRSQLVGRAGGVIAVAQAPGKLLFGGNDGVVSLVTVEGAEAGEVRAELHRLRGHGGRVFQVALSPDGLLGASVGRDGLLRVHDLQGGARSVEWEFQDSWATSVAFSPSGAELIVGLRDGSARVFDLENARVASVRAHEGRVWSVAFSPSGRYFATGGRDGRAVVWELEKVKSTAISLHSDGFGEFLSRLTSAVVAEGKQLVTPLDLSGEILYGQE